MDAIGGQKSVSRALTGATYLLALKGTRAARQTAGEAVFAAVGSAGAATTAGKKPAHGRTETRTCRVLPATVMPTSLRGPDWVGLQTLVEVVATRTVVANGTTHTETRDYLSSYQAMAASF